MPKLYLAGLALASFFSTVLSASNVCALNITIVQGQTCPAGHRLMTYQEAQADQNQVCHSMGQWFIGRLAGNGSIDGPGYDCRMRPSDDRTLTNAVCVAETTPAWSVSAIHNNSGREITLLVPIGAGATLTKENTLGDAERLALDAVDLGLVKFSQAQQVSSAYGAFWRVSISSNGSNLSYFFNRPGSIDLTLNSDASLTIVPTAGGQIVPDGSAPHC